jgi:hypothetical protein
MPVRPVGGLRVAVVASLMFVVVVLWMRAPAAAWAEAIQGPPTVAGSRGLPDGRQYELVSPAVKPGGTGGVLPLTNEYQEYGALQASSTGESVTYLGEDFFEPQVGGVNQYLSTRSSSGWGTASISPATSAPTPEFYSNQFIGNSRNLERHVRTSNQDLTQSDLPPGYRLGHAGLPAGYADLWLFNAEAGVVEPLVTSTPPNREPGEFRIEFVGASADYTRIFFQANDVLAPGAEDGGYEGFNLYEWSDGNLRLVNVLENGTTPSHSYFGSRAEEEHGNFENAVSIEGTRVIWSDLTDGTLYLSELGAKPIEVDHSEGPGASGGGTYFTASTDGTRVFFSDTSQLTTDSTAAEGSPDLYEYSLATHKLTDLTVDPNVGGHADVLGLAGSSNDGTYVYFVAEGALAPGAVAGEDNLYLAHSGHLEFIAALSSEDANDRTFYQFRNGRFGDWSQIPGIRTTDVTPNGHLLAFVSVRSLTHYENEGVTEVYLYNATTNQLRCASCNPTGAKPLGLSALPVTNFLTDPPQWLSEEGEGGDRLFFDSYDALVPWDTNHQMDVYEYEGGKISLISAGTGPYESGLATASEGGNNVFFTTSDQLVPQDPDELIDLYDARVGGGFPASSHGEPCSEPNGCRGGSGEGAPESSVPASSLLQGAGNVVPAPVASTPVKKTAAEIRAARLRKALKSCKAKRNRQKRAKCEATAHRKYAPPKTSKKRKGSKASKKRKGSK